MNKYADLKMTAYALQAVGVLSLLSSLLLMVSYPDVRIAVVGLIALIWWYALGGVLLVLIDIANSQQETAVASRATAKAMMRLFERKSKVKPSDNGKPLGLHPVSSKKGKSA